ncbi:MAG: PIN domain nuclease [Chloroflexota bacterium]|nr:PIN domain nuclease [Chloroflexota bacterium]
MSTLIDSSVMIAFFRGHQTPSTQRLKQLIAEDRELLIGDLILAELLQGIRESERFQVESVLRTLSVAPLVGEAIARQSAANHRQLRRRGITVRKTIDCLIATWCIENRVPLLHADRDFSHFVDLGSMEA